MKGVLRFAAMLAAALGLHAPASRAATAEELARVQFALQAAAAPWCERLSERDDEGRKRCTIRLRAMPDERVRAFALLGDVIITAPLLAVLSEAELALIGGHEMAHVVLGHPPAWPAPATDGANALLDSLSVPPRDDTAKDRLQMELDADRLGLFFAGLAGYPVQQLAKGWPALIARLPLKPSTGDDAHPASAMRVAQLQAAADEFCSRGRRGDLLAPAVERLQPRYEIDAGLLREQQSRLPIVWTCRLPTPP